MAADKIQHDLSEGVETAGPAAGAPPFDLIAPETPLCGLVFSSPHSGDFYPPHFLAATRLDSATLRCSEDAFVDALFGCATELGAPMLRARYPRAYLDLNREPYELDPRMFEERLPEFANTRSLRVAAGLGTVPRVVADAREIYAGKLAVAEAMRRIEDIYKPYHAQLGALMDDAVKRFGVAVLVDCHSMPTLFARDPALASLGDKRPVDIVIGDRFGASCETRFVDAVETKLMEFGYAVQRNRPYAGGFITEHYGRPGASRHALQIEVARGLYMDELALEPNERFAILAEHLREALSELARELRLLADPKRLAAE